jgi:PPE-repeat protein
MKKSISLLLVVMATATFLFSCKKSDSDSDGPKTLNKSTLTTKSWYNQGGTIIHQFKTGGYYANTGTWKWVNNSDTMEIVTVSGGFKTYWKFYWNTDHEMSCQKVGTSSSELYKDQLW